MDTWERIRQLIGQTLQTVQRRRTFVFDAVGERTLVVIPDDGDPRPIWRRVMEGVVELHQDNPGLTRQQIQQALPGSRNTSYLLAISRQLTRTVRV